MTSPDINLHAWQCKRMTTVHAGRFDYGRGPGGVTIVMYFFWGTDRAAREWDSFECAIRETWLRCGMMKTVLVTNTKHPCVTEFAAKFPNVDVQIDDALVPGRIATMSFDCVTKLHTRFSTSYVLVIQNDGFPLRCGLEEFIGKYDFIGAPTTRDGLRILMTLGFPCLNGGFSLRSRRFCERVSKSWNGIWHHLLSVNSRFFAEDTFATFTAMFSPFFRRGLRIPSEREAFRFSYDTLIDYVSLPDGASPFGFHGQHTAEKLLAENKFFEV